MANKIFNFFKKNKKDDKPQIDTTGCAEVIIEDKELAVTLGQWMGLLPELVKTGSLDFSLVTSLSAKELMKNLKITKEDLDNINKHFALLLKQIGFGEGNICTLKDFNNDDLSFRCLFNRTGEVAYMSIKFGSFLDNGPELIVDFDNIKTVYDYWDFDKSKPPVLKQDTIEKALDNQGKRFYRYISPYTYYADVFDNEHKICIEIKYPHQLKDGEDAYPYIDKDTMEDELSSISFPVSIEEICKRVASGLRVDSKEFPSISITLKKKINKEKEIITDEAAFQNGYLIKLTITKNDKTITLRNFEEWTYNTPQYDISQTNDKRVSYGFKSIPADKLESMPTPQEMIAQASQDVSDVRVLAKTLLHPKKEK